MNTLESCYIVNPKNIEDECAKFVIDNTESSFILSEITQTGVRYTLSFWIKSETDSAIQTFNSTFSSSVEWQKHSIVFTATAENVTIKFVNPGVYYIYHPKLEIGNRMTDWSPAPEDTIDEIISSSDAIRDDMIQREVDMTESYNQTINNVLSGYVSIDEYGEFKNSTQTGLEDLSNDTQDKFNTIDSALSDLDETTNAKIAEFHKYIEFTDNGIRISSSNSAIMLELDNERGILFRKNEDTEPFGCWDGNDFYTGNIVVKVTERAQFGSFAFIPRSDGSLSFLKVGETTNGS